MLCKHGDAMRFFIDTEFEDYGSRAPIRLLSIGIVAEDGREYYAESDDISPVESDWIRENVLPFMTGADFRGEFQITSDILAFVGDDPKPEFWGYYCDYDYVVFANIFGGIVGWPKGWPYLFYDLRQSLDQAGLQHITQPDSTHNALDDARWIAQAFFHELTPYERVTP